MSSYRSTGEERSIALRRWRITLADIPSSFGRLVYLSAHRDRNNGRYEDYSLSAAIGPEEGDEVLRECHRQVFSEWIGYTLQQQRADLDLYLSCLPDRKAVVIHHWLQLQPYVGLIPNGSSPEERELYSADMRVLLRLYERELNPSR